MAGGRILERERLLVDDPMSNSTGHASDGQKPVERLGNAWNKTDDQETPWPAKTITVGIPHREPLA